MASRADVMRELIADRALAGGCGEAARREARECDQLTAGEYGVVQMRREDK